MAKVDVSGIYGRIRFTDVNADYVVRVVSSQPWDLSVKRVNQSLGISGQWQIVEQEPADFRIRLSDVGADFTIRWEL